MKVLVTGGAGYIGSHVVLDLIEAGHDVTVYDNLSSSRPAPFLSDILVVGDLSDRDQLGRILQEKDIEAVLHFAGSVRVEESMSHPLAYYRNNTLHTLDLVELCVDHGIGTFIFSSTAAVYGIPEIVPVSESAPLSPISPYGASKMMSERIIEDAATAHPLNYVILRYFNVAGADPALRTGQQSDEATHLIRVACQTALGLRPKLEIFGDDYPTPDGTCVRDYIHVCDLARAHVDALHHLANSGPSAVLNVGYGRGFSVSEVVDVVKEVSGIDFPTEVGPRRPGDSPQLVAETSRIRETLDWTPNHEDLREIVETAYLWEQKLASRQQRTRGG